MTSNRKCKSQIHLDSTDRIKMEVDIFTAKSDAFVIFGTGQIFVVMAAARESLREGKEIQSQKKD